MLQNKWVRRGALSIVGLLSAVLGLANSASANYRHHLDVHRYCRRVFAQGGEWNGRQYTSDGWHHYNRRANRHECHFDYRVLGEVNSNVGSGISILGIPIFNGGLGTSQPSVSNDIRRGEEEVWIHKACREQNNNPSVWAQQEGGVVWCVFP